MKFIFFNLFYFSILLISFWCDAFDVIFLIRQAWVPSLMGGKVHILTLGCGEGKCSVYCRHQRKESQAANLQKTWQWPQCF